MTDESDLEDFLDEEVVDQHGTPVGTLACFWQTEDDAPAFYGVCLQSLDQIRVVPVRRSRVDERHSCIRLGFDLIDIESAPGFDCGDELTPDLQNKVNDHYAISPSRTSAGLRLLKGGTMMKAAPEQPDDVQERS